MSGSSTVVRLEDVLAEGTSGQWIEVDLTDGDGDAINVAAIASLHGTLRSLETGALLFEQVDLVASGRATYPGAAGRVRVTLTAADCAASGTRRHQSRELTILVRHSDDQAFACAVQFGLLAIADVGV